MACVRRSTTTYLGKLDINQQSIFFLSTVRVFKFTLSVRSLDNLNEYGHIEQQFLVATTANIPDAKRRYWERRRRRGYPHP
jgi:hypothetical protein